MGKVSTENLIGKVFGRLTVVDTYPRGKQGHVQWVCACSCGSSTVVTSSNLKHGKVQSCGCLSRETRLDKANQTGLGTGWEQACSYCGAKFRALSHKQVYCSSRCSFLGRRVARDTECIEWTGSVVGGYGVLSVNAGEKRKLVLAHRFAYELFKGPIPNGLCVCHACDNPLCTNPDHLFLGTLADNNRDRSNKGRSGRRAFTEEDLKKYSDMNRGERNNSAKLTEEKVRAIRQLHGIETVKTIAKKFGVSESAIKSIFQGRTWAHVK